MDSKELEVNVEEMLEARDRRVALQSKLLKEYKTTLICFTMNIPGPIKVNPLVEMGFKDGCTELLAALSEVKMEVVHKECIAEKTGFEAYYVVKAEAKEVKKITCVLENKDALGRLFDIDVLDVDGRKISREEINLPGRLCLVCQEPAQACARSRKHTLEVLGRHVRMILEEHLFDKVEYLAAYALLEEVYTTPKPGLVDRDNNGAHKDMDCSTFEKSTKAIAPFFREMAVKGYSWKSTGEALFQAIRPIGSNAEKAMFKATGNVNTHKGIIFSLGIICAFSLWYFAQHSKFDSEKILELAGESLAPFMEKDFAKIDKYHPHTHGEKLFVKYGVKGIRGEAEEGFPPLRFIALPLMRRLKVEGKDKNLINIEVLLNLMAKVEDTNILIRTNPEMLVYCKEKAAEILAKGGAFTEEGMQAVWALNDDFVAKNMSPGGSADLLIATIFLTELEA